MHVNDIPSGRESRNRGDYSGPLSSVGYACDAFSESIPCARCTVTEMKQHDDDS